jgi:predicted nucleotidyltransferase
MTPTPLPPHSCPADCPNRSQPASHPLKLFGHKIDPIEIALHCLVAVVVLVPATRRSVQADFKPIEALAWMGAMGFGSAIVRMSPTARLNAYATLLKPPSQ